MESLPILPKPVTEFMDKFRQVNYEIAVVGGAVRHLLLAQPVSDWDFTTSATPEAIRDIYKDNFYNNEFGTVTIPIKVKGEEQLFEVTPYRHEGIYVDFRRPETVEWAQNIEEDLKRRDFTINAIAYDGERLIDLFDGKGDIKRKLVRAVGNPDTRFAEDALRLMRAVRFATQLGFTIEEETELSIKRNAELISKISSERIRDELLKILSSERAADGILLLKDTSLLKHILPELEDCFGVEQKSPGRHHIHDVGTHLIEALRHCPSTDPIVRLSTLLHDIGKPKTADKIDETGTITFYNHEIIGAEMVSAVADRLRLSNEQKNKLVTLVRHHMFSVSEEQTDKAVRRFLRNIGLENVDSMLALRTGDRLGSGATETSWRTEDFKKRILEVQKMPFSIKDLKINGTDVMKELGIKPGPRIGEILKEIFEEVDDGKIKNEREALIERVKQAMQS